MVWFIIMVIRNATILISAITLLIGCTEPMDPVSYVDSLRIMAIQAEEPEIRPGQGTTMHALYSDPAGEGRDLTLVWLSCIGALDPSDDIDENACSNWDFQLGTPEQNGDTYQLPAPPEDILDDLKKAAEEDKTITKYDIYKKATVILLICAGGELADVETMMQVDGLDDIDDICVGGDSQLAFKSVKISEAESEDVNLNPELAFVKFMNYELIETVDDEERPEAIFNCETTAECLEGADIAAAMTDESFQTYNTIEQGEEVTKDEAPYVSWFATGGELDNNRCRTAEPPGPFKNSWSPPLDGGDFILWVVAHDLRGGVSWKKYAIGATTNIDI